MSEWGTKSEFPGRRWALCCFFVSQPRPLCQMASSTLGTSLVLGKCWFLSCKVKSDNVSIKVTAQAGLCVWGTGKLIHRVLPWMARAGKLSPSCRLGQTLSRHISAETCPRLQTSWRFLFLFCTHQPDPGMGLVGKDQKSPEGMSHGGKMTGFEPGSPGFEPWPCPSLSSEDEGESFNLLGLSDASCKMRITVPSAVCEIIFVKCLSGSCGDAKRCHGFLHS